MNDRLIIKDIDLVGSKFSPFTVWHHSRAGESDLPHLLVLTHPFTAPDKGSSQLNHQFHFHCDLEVCQRL